VGELCRAKSRATTLVEDNHGRRFNEVGLKRAADSDSKSFVSSLELPRYSSDLASSSVSQPPAYFSPSSLDQEHETHGIGLKSAYAREKDGRPQRLSSDHSEKMQLDLESVTAAIDRLHMVSPQFANQRVEPDRRQLRERQLTKLGNAIERLSLGRMNDQRATAVVHEQMVRSRKQERTESVELDELIDRINRAASRTFTDQRFEITCACYFFSFPMHIISLIECLDHADSEKRSLNVSTLIPSSIDAIEVERREFILEHSGKGRIASQDANFANGPPPASTLFPSAPSLCSKNSTTSTAATDVTFAEFFRNHNLVNDLPGPSASSLPCPLNPVGQAPTMKKKLSSMFQKNDSSSSPSRLNVFRNIAIPPSMSRRGSCDAQMESPDSAKVLGTTQPAAILEST
jgi:hypothetical protein